MDARAIIEAESPKGAFRSLRRNLNIDQEVVAIFNRILDTGNYEEAWGLAAKLSSGYGWRAYAAKMFPARPPGYVKTLQNIGHFFNNWSTAKRQRAENPNYAGHDTPQMYLNIAKRIYDQLPDYAKWRGETINLE